MRGLWAWSGVLMAAGLCGCRTSPPPAVEVLPPVVSIAEAAEETVDRRPYELVWSGRREVHEPLVDFDFLLGWEARDDRGEVLAFDRSREDALWGTYVGRLVLPATATVARVVIQPPKPIDFVGRVDAVTLWVHHQAPAAGSLRTTAVRVWVRDAQGRRHEIPLGQFQAGGWNYLHARISDAEARNIEHPCQVEALVLLSDGMGEPGGTILLDSLAIITEEFPPLALPERPRSPLALPAGQSRGLHRAEATLPFPRREETVLPESGPPEGRGRNELRVEKDRLTCHYRASDGELTYRWSADQPRQGVSLSWGERELGQVLRGDQLRWEAEPGWEAEVLRLEEGRCHVAYTNGVEADWSMTNKSLIFDCRSRGGGVLAMASGAVFGPEGFQPLAIPGLAGPVEGLVQVGWMPGEPPLFLSVINDPYRSNGSRWGVEGEGDDTPTGVVYYDADSQGQRADLYERWIVTVSDRIEDVLPVVAQAPGAHREAIRERIWVDYPGTHSAEGVTRFTDELAGLGVREVLFAQGRACWQDAQESCTLRVRPAPGWGTEADLRRLLQHQADAGWMAGLYIDYLNLHPLNAYWSENRLLRSTGLDWRAGLPGHYRVKPVAAVGLQQEIAVTNRAHYQAGLTYVAGMTAEAPWRHTDYDARVPGAGTYGQAYQAIGELLITEKALIEGPVVGDGQVPLLYAGLADALLTPDGMALTREPYLPLFYQGQLNPVAAMVGAGATVSGGDTDRGLDGYLAAQIAYGLQGRVPATLTDPVRRVRAYHLMHRLQRHTAGRVPTRIAYSDGESYFTTSAAIAEGVWTTSHLYLQYGEDLELWVNGSPERTWEVRIGGTVRRLPPFGWFVLGEQIQAGSLEIEGSRIDFVVEPDYRYLDGRGAWIAHQGLVSPVPVWMSRNPDGDDEDWWVRHPFGGSRVEVALPFSGARRVVYRPDGSASAKETLVRVADRFVFDVEVGTPYSVVHGFDATE